MMGAAEGGRRKRLRGAALWEGVGAQPRRGVEPQAEGPGTLLCRVCPAESGRRAGGSVRDGGSSEPCGVWASPRLLERDVSGCWLKMDSGQGQNRGPWGCDEAIRAEEGPGLGGGSGDSSERRSWAPGVSESRASGNCGCVFLRERDEGVRGRGIELQERSRRLPDRHTWERGWRERRLGPKCWPRALW